jgi:uncharacterized protein
MPHASLRARNIEFRLREGPAGEAPTRGNDMSSDNKESAKKAYAAYGVGDVETAVNTFADDVEWSVPGNSKVSGTYHGKGEFIALLGKLAEKSFTTTPERIIGDGDDVVVVTRTTAGGESALQADVLTYRDGKLVKAVSVADTAMQERVYGTK